VAFSTSYHFVVPLGPTTHKFPRSLFCTMTFLYYDQQMHNYFTNYYTPTCFDTIVSCSSWSLSQYLAKFNMHFRCSCW